MEIVDLIATCILATINMFVVLYIHTDMKRQKRDEKWHRLYELKLRASRKNLCDEEKQLRKEEFQTYLFAHFEAELWEKIQKMGNAKMYRLVYDQTTLPMYHDRIVYARFKYKRIKTTMQYHTITLAYIISTIF